jgi:TnpA family transposase
LHIFVLNHGATTWNLRDDTLDELGLVQAGGLMRTLQTNDRPTRLARALEELGRIIKTLYLLAYIDDEAYRRRILNQLNRGVGRHQLARVVFHGKRGELRQRYREGQEDQLGALGLVVSKNAALLNSVAAPGRGSRVRS